jgi:hypothetical protein
MVLKTYFTRNNTIISNQITNTGQNPVTELFYGSPDSQLYSRFLFQFDTTRLEEFINKGMFPDLSKFKHTLKMTNTGSFDASLMGATTFNNKERSSSFDLNLFKLNQSWDEGVGYDYYKMTYVNQPATISTSPSNWFECKTNDGWDILGAISGSPIATQHFEHGNENVNMDITPIVNSFLTGVTNNGFCLSYPESLELTIRDDSQYVGFFTRHSQTFYEPYVESVYGDRILDNRINFYLNKNNKLYLYVNVGGKPTNLDFLPIVNVYNDNNDMILSTTGNSSSQGVYYIDINIPEDSQNDCTMYTDIWSNLYVNGNHLNDIEMDFSVKTEGYYNLGSDVNDNQDYKVSVLGIKFGEKIKRGDIRKVIVNAKVPYTTNTILPLEDIEYRLYVKEGFNQLTVIDYQPMNLSKNQNYFLLDTLSLLPNTYYLDIRYSNDYEVKVLENVLSFNIASEVNFRYSQ